MTLTTVVARLVVGLLTMLAVASVVFVGSERLWEAARSGRHRARDVAPHVVVLVAILAANKLVREAGSELSWIVGWNITAGITAIEGSFVAAVQSVAVPPLTAYFSFVYIYGYTFLLAFPVIAYFALADPRPLQVTILAYVCNYALGLVAYVLFIAYGPRNMMPDAVDALLYTTYPQTQLLTRQVNVNTNVFPSLHASLAITVALLARRTRDRYPGWYALAVALAASVVVSTMYLGIHWATDVVAGAVLAVVSTTLAVRLVEPSLRRWTHEGRSAA